MFPDLIIGKLFNPFLTKPSRFPRSQRILSILIRVIRDNAGAGADG